MKPREREIVRAGEREGVKGIKGMIDDSGFGIEDQVKAIPLPILRSHHIRVHRVGLALR